MILVLGEILFDVFPDGKRLGGAPFNFAYHLKMLDFNVRFISRVGRDGHGDEILDFLQQSGFDINDIQQDPDHSTGSVLVTVHPGGSHDFSIVPDTAYDYLAYDSRIRSLCRDNWSLFYFGTLIQRSTGNTRLIKKICAQKPGKAKVFCDINLRPGCYTPASIETCLSLADLLKLNDEELAEISGDRYPDRLKTDSIRHLMQTYSLEQLLLTRAEKGSQWFAAREVHTSRVPDKCPDTGDTVGAGDAYAAMAVAGYLAGNPPEKAMRLAQEFAGTVCEIKGAIPGDRSVYREFQRRLTK